MNCFLAGKKQVENHGSRVLLLHVQKALAQAVTASHEQREGRLVASPANDIAPPGQKTNSRASFLNVCLHSASKKLLISFLYFWFFSVLKKKLNLQL